MKKSIFIFCFLLFIILSYGQSWSPANKAMGCEFKPINFVFDSITYLISLKTEKFLNKKLNGSEPLVSFLFNKNTIITSYSTEDPKSFIKVLGEIDEKTDKDHTYRRLQCEDNSGKKMVLALAYTFETKINSIIIVYKNNTYYYEVEKGEIPEKPYFILDNIEELGHINDGNFGSDYTNEEVNEFLSFFGNPDIIMGFIIKDLLEQDWSSNNKPQEWQKHKTKSKI